MITPLCELKKTAKFKKKRARKCFKIDVFSIFPKECENAKFDVFWPFLALFGLFLKLLELPGAAPGAGGTSELKKNAE